MYVFAFSSVPRIVERSDLAALEYLMSKQPRGNVRVGAGNSVGTRVSNIFVDVKKFQAKFADAKNKAARKVRNKSAIADCRCCIPYQNIG